MTDRGSRQGCSRFLVAHVLLEDPHTALKAGLGGQEAGSGASHGSAAHDQDIGVHGLGWGHGTLVVFSTG